MVKVCKTCKRELSLTAFNRRYATCKECLKLRYAKSPEQRQREYARHRRYYALERARLLEHKRLWYRDNGERLRACRRRRYQADINFKLRCLLRGRLYQLIKGGGKGGSAITSLGCTLEQLREHIEQQWAPGMTWDNWGRYGWHLDHIIPLSHFDLSDPKQVEAACHFSNLRPLWAKDNLSRGNRV